VKESGISVASVLGIVFIILKLCNVIAWSWWWVLAPFWMPLGFLLLAIMGAFIFMWIADWMDERA
jgi:hypothetical protein